MCSIGVHVIHLFNNYGGMHWVSVICMLWNFYLFLLLLVCLCLAVIISVKKLVYCVSSDACYVYGCSKMNLRLELNCILPITCLSGHSAEVL